MIRSQMFAAGGAALLVAGAGTIGMAYAGTQESQFTGCLKNGNLSNIAANSDTPASPCGRGATQVTWSQTGPSGLPGEAGATGSDGRSAYEIWLDAGNRGSESDFLDSLKGAPGADGASGLGRVYQTDEEFVTVRGGFRGSVGPFKCDSPEDVALSAYPAFNYWGVKVVTQYQFGTDRFGFEVDNPRDTENYISFFVLCADVTP